MLFDRKPTPLRVGFFCLFPLPPRPTRYSIKPAVDFTQPLQKLQDRGLVVAVEPWTLHYLANIGYLGFSGY